MLSVKIVTAQTLDGLSKGHECSKDRSVAHLQETLEWLQCPNPADLKAEPDSLKCTITVALEYRQNSKLMYKVLKIYQAHRIVVLQKSGIWEE